MDVLQFDSTETCGEYQDEREAVRAFDELVQRTGLFKSYSEVTGHLLHPRPAAEDKMMRIDRLLLPSKKLLAAGWKHGAIGVESKRSGVKVGPAIAQAMDYSRTVWVSPDTGLRVMTNYTVVWPLGEIRGVVHSILMQNNIGGVCLKRDSRDDRLLFHLGYRNVILEYDFGSQTLFTGSCKAGRRAGSR
jgi:hypothetical protein